MKNLLIVAICSCAAIVLTACHAGVGLDIW